ncbi:MAG: type VI secretion system-associated protein TagF [Pseudomonadota bacterium]
MSGRVGVFGKIAGLGDFVRRDLSDGFVEVWDPWLARMMTESRALLGPGWESAYASAPIWRFALAPGLAGRGARIGVLMPSQDRVGRYFPLTLVAAMPAEKAAAALGDDAALRAMEEVALDTLDYGRGIGALDAALARLHAPTGGSGPALVGSHWCHAGDGLVQRHTGLPAGSDFASMLRPADLAELGA